MKYKQVTTSIRELKAKASHILRQVEKKRREVVVTRRGKPCAKIVPLQEVADGEKAVPLETLRGKYSYLPTLSYEEIQKEIKKMWRKSDE